MGLPMDERRRSRVELAEAFIDSYENLVCVADFLGQYVACNRAVTLALGWSEKELCDYGFADLAPPHEREEVMKLGASIIRGQGGARRSYARPMRHKDGSYRLVHWTVWADAQHRLVFGVGYVQGVVQVD
jgi:PAS domain S-box-containing protein